MKLRHLLLITALLALAACDMPAPTSDEKANRQQELLQMQSVNAVGMPAITKFSEKRALKSIFELRDKEVVTYTYIVALDNRLKLLCQSVGYGIPYATEYTSPQRPAGAWETHHAGNLALPQADPNGLFSPASADGTWILCLNPETRLASPLYVEPRVIVSPFELKN